MLYVLGSVASLSEPQLAMVGSRNPTAGGRATAREFAVSFARMGLGITSGLALGIDAACHEGALAAGGVTVAVLGCGLDSVYPTEHEALAARIAASGALVSEFPPGTPALQAHFPQRNRIIAGLAHGTLVVEAAQRSGSLITARLAGIAGREVFAIPGSIHNPLARGCHQLIRQGAKLVEGVEDVLAELKISLSDQLLVNPGEGSPSARGAGRVGQGIQNPVRCARLRAGKRRELDRTHGFEQRIDRLDAADSGARRARGAAPRRPIQPHGGTIISTATA